MTTEARLAECSLRLRLAVVPLARALRQQVADGFTPTQLSVIGSIHRNRPITLSELAARERLSLPTISKVVTILEEKGIIERISDATDRRVCRVSTTVVGAQWVEQGRARRDAWLTRRLARLDPAEQAAIAAALPALEQLIDRVS